MRKRLLPALLALLLLAGCTSAGTAPAPGSPSLRVLCTTYPVYLFTTSVSEGVEDVEVSLLVNSQTSCLHDYTLTVENMKAIEGADVIVMNGVGLEEFMDDALAQSEAAVIDCSAGVELLPLLEEHDHDGHGHEEEYDPHIWMDPDNAVQMVETISRSLAELDPDHGETYNTNAAAAAEALAQFIQQSEELREEAALSYYTGHPEIDFCPPLGEMRFYWHPNLITFHDGFQYFAKAYGLELLKAIEEEEGATASAAEIREISALIEEHGIPAIFTEKNGSATTAEAIARETGCQVCELDMLMSGEGSGIGPYIDRMGANLDAIMEAFQ